MAAADALDARQDGVENLLELSGAEEQLVDLSQRLEGVKLLLQAAGAMIEHVDEDSRLIRTARHDRLEAAHLQRRQTLLELSQRVQIPPTQVQCACVGTGDGDQQHERQHHPDSRRTDEERDLATECNDGPWNGSDPLVDERHMREHTVPFVSATLPRERPNRGATFS